ncbi:sulfatase-like hydrolase/transferase [Crateriforma conspicua]|uniref:sulfatase-like hydrolase/transferase n=1 Tax=Crateriforma conspicua TaxID=2527996 RepID=UPI00118BC1CF|nr:sulfatase-like hydrolase/transferase [Crateriforma conspicua]QDV66028.1 Arylsulfatase precursor [Crateriforma conspicua]
MDKIYMVLQSPRVIIVTLIVVLSTMVSRVPLFGDDPRPNIILVFIDDLGWSDLGCFGNRQADTPAIDRLASEGIAFEQFYVNSPICSPSRVAITTGQYPQRWRITSYLDASQVNRRRGLANWLDPRAPTLARALQRQGYATGHFGKWHMGGQRDVDAAPPISQYGFDVSITNFEGMGPKYLPMTLAPGWEKPRKIWEDAERLGGPYEWSMRSQITTDFASAAIDFIKASQAADRPFYVNLWPDDVHGPWFPTLKHWRQGVPGLYLSVLQEMDTQLRALFDLICDDDILRENTLIVFCSDNGPDPKTFDPASKPLRGCKATLYENGIRSPLIVWGPGFVSPEKQGTRDAETVLAAFDLAPSLLRLVGIDASAKTPFDGEDMLDALLGHRAVKRSDSLCFSRPPDFKDFGNEKNLPDLAIRKDRWKFLCDVDGGRPQLYDLHADPGETQNVADQHSELAQVLTDELLHWKASLQPSGMTKNQSIGSSESNE